MNFAYFLNCFAAKSWPRASGRPSVSEKSFCFGKYASARRNQTTLAVQRVLQNGESRVLCGSTPAQSSR